jgi:four helix bundle protein
MISKDLIVWKKADELAIAVYAVTKRFPRNEVYVITAQIRRAVISVPTNIVEGYARKGDKELARFVNIAIERLQKQSIY